MNRFQKSETAKPQWTLTYSNIKYHDYLKQFFVDRRNI